MMLVMAVKSADDQVRQTQTESDAAQQAEIDQLESERDLRLAQVEGLDLVRPEALSRLGDSRANRSHIEEQIRKLKREFHRIGKELLELDRETKKIAQLKDPTVPVLPKVPLSFQADENQNRQVLQKLSEQIAQAKEQLEVKRTAAQQDGPAKFVIVPHKGGGGTFRRPIFMECTHDAITLQPSGIRLAKSEFVPPLQPGNMLDSALLTVREYWGRYDLAGQEGAAYPLIVVRPGGAQTFVLARQAMKSWDDEFGYELVEAQTNLDFGVKDPQLQTEVREAINEARLRQQQQLARSRFLRSREGQLGSLGSDRIRGRGARGSKRNLRPGLIAADSQGGFVSNVGQYSEGGGGSGYHEDQNDSYVSAASGVSGESEASRYENDSRHENDSHYENDTTQENDAVQQDFSRSQQNQSLAGQAGENKFNSSSDASQANQSTSSHSSQEGTSDGPNPYGNQAIAQDRGADWALPTQTPGATGYVRPIRVVCSHDALEVVAGGSSKRIQMTGATADAIDPLIDQVWAQIDQWGIPGANAYWKPQLRFQILDGGRQRYLEIKGLLYKSGLTLTSTPPKQGQQ